MTNTILRTWKREEKRNLKCHCLRLLSLYFFFMIYEVSSFHRSMGFNALLLRCWWSKNIMKHLSSTTATKVTSHCVWKHSSLHDFSTWLWGSNECVRCQMKPKHPEARGWLWKARRDVMMTHRSSKPEETPLTDKLLYVAWYLLLL